MHLVLERCGHVISSYIPLKILEDTSVVIDGDEIVCIGECHGYTGYDRLDCRGKVVAPAFGNAHVHVTSILEYVREINPRRAVAVAVINMASNGIAAFQSMDEDYTTIVDVARSVGLRVRAGPVVRDGRCTYPIIEDVSYHLYSPIVSVEDLLEIDEDVLKSCMENLFSRKLDIQISISKTIEEALKFRRRKGFLPIEYLARKSLLSSRVVLSHINWITSWEVEFIAYYKPRIVVCPYSDALSGINGLPPIKILLERNIAVGIGTETFAHRGSSNMLQDIASIIALYRYSNTDIGIEQTMHLATQGSYSVMNINAGSVEVGKKADIVVLSIKRVKPKLYTGQPLLPLVIHEGYIDTTIVNGDIVWSVDEMDRYVKLLSP